MKLANHSYSSEEWNDYELANFIHRYYNFGINRVVDIIYVKSDFNMYVISFPCKK